MKGVDVICVGAAKFDLDAVVDAIPSDDERIYSHCLINGVGGPSIVAALAIARLGVRVGFCGVVGRDVFGDFVLSVLEQHGVSRQWVERREGLPTCSSMNIISRQKSTRAIITMPAPAPDPAVVATLRAAWIHFDDIGIRSSDGLRKARPDGIRFSVDGGNHIDNLDLRGIDLYVPTLSRLAHEQGKVDVPHDENLAREVMRHAVHNGARAVVATDGAQGSYILAGNTFVRIPGFPVDVISTLGAGDVFHGAILAALSLGKSLPEATKWANACAALSCRAIDGYSMVPTQAELKTYLASH